MTKRLIEIEDELLQQARRALGTKTIKDTVSTALRRPQQRASRPVEPGGASALRRGGTGPRER
ncbi:MAG TPA: antitoxin [Actinobacteria bacterium]|jgi:Arc/MetJ family transcription regulator|nr:antitoxin [Actinomycetota bacterium]HCP60858.1 antitoxin [Actinomycetota bacterium]